MLFPETDENNHETHVEMNHVSNLGTRLRNCNGSGTNLLLVSI